MKTKYLIKKILRKIYHFIGFISLFIIFLTPVKADTYQIEIENRKSNQPLQSQVDYIYNTLISQYPSSDYEYYILNFPFSSDLYVQFYKKDTIITQDYSFNIQSNNFTIEFNIETTKWYECTVSSINPQNTQCTEYSGNSHNTGILQTRNEGGNSENIFYYSLYDTSLVFNSEVNMELEGFYQDNILINYGDNLPKLKNLYEYNSWLDYEDDFLDGYTEVNLNNYEYVLLSLKDYNQTQPFQTNLQVKGQIGITPIYNYGQTSKDTITGSQVQDRCNLTYSNYTAYPFYILQSDLQNNVIYAVKSCSSNSSFKFDSSLFDITYITQENKDNPQVTINGNTYNVIPYDDLPSTATKNEIDNYIPGESGGATSTGGLNSAIKNSQQKLSELWDTFTYFTSFISQIFSTLPDPMQTILLSAFTIAILIGLIKLFSN